MLTLGIIVMLGALLALLSNLRTSYLTHGGSIGQVPVVASAAIQVPLLFMLGLWLVDTAAVRTWGIPWWSYPLLWVALVITAGWLTIKAGELGKSRHPHAD